MINHHQATTWENMKLELFPSAEQTVANHKKAIDVIIRFKWLSLWKKDETVETLQVKDY